MSGGADRIPGEDTVELELTAAEQLELARAHAAALGSPKTSPDKPGYDTFIYARTRRVDVAGTITFAALVCGATAAMGWHALLREPVAREAAATAFVTRPAPIVRAQPRPAVVQVVNPFDATEVFELPAQTSEAEAREAIADLLLQRARERRQQGFELHRASSHQPHPAAPVKPSDVFVTKLLSSVNRFDDTANLRGGSGADE
jgi:hypothetical protein